MLCKGVFDRLELLDDCVVITRTPVVGFVLFGLVGAKRIPYFSISAIQFKRSGALSGYIQFTIPGGVESTKGLWKASQDENTVVFTNNEVFEKARDFIENKIAQHRRGGSTIQTSSPAEQLEKLAGLMERGLLTQEEFFVQKQALLGQPFNPLDAPPAPRMPSTESESTVEADPPMSEAMRQAIEQHKLRPAQVSEQRTAPTFGKRTAS